MRAALQPRSSRRRLLLVRLWCRQTKWGSLTNAIFLKIHCQALSLVFWVIGAFPVLELLTAPSSVLLFPLPGGKKAVQGSSTPCPSRPVGPTTHTWGSQLRTLLLSPIHSVLNIERPLFFTSLTITHLFINLGCSHPNLTSLFLLLPPYSR